MTSYTRTMREAREEMLQAESMSSAQIDKLKKAYEPMRDKRISTANANKLSAMMDRFAKDKDVLIQLFKADIPFVSQSAVTKLIIKYNMKGAELNKLRERFGVESVELDEMKSKNYALAVKGKFVAVGSKADMMKMKKQKGGEVYMSPGAKVGGSPGKAEDVDLDEALNPKDKKVVDAFYDGRSMDGKMLSTDGKKLEKTGMGGQTIASKSGNKFKIVAKMDSKSTQDVVKYIEKSFPKNVIEEVELDEALPPHLAKYIGKDGDFTPEVKKRLGKDFMKRMRVPSKKKSNVKDVTPKGYGPDEELDESAAGIAQLKKAYEPLRGKKISLDNAKKLSAIMNKFADDKAMLMKLVKADIPFVTQSAVTKLITKHGMKGAEINKMMEEEKTLTTDARYKTFREKLLKLGYQKADIDEKAPKMKTTDIMRDRGKKAGPQTYQVDIEGAGRATVKAANEKMAIQKAMTQMKINKKIKPLPKATVKVMEEVELDEAVKITHVLIDTADGNKVKAMASSEKGVMQSKNSAERPPMSVKDKNTLKVVQLKKPVSQKASEKMVGHPLNEEVELDEAFKINPVNVKLNDGSMVKISKADASALNGLYNSLNPANAKTMIKKMMQDKKSYGEILAFANQAM